MHKIQYAKSLGLMISLSLAVLPMLLPNGLTSIKMESLPNSEYVYGEQEESVEETYLKFVSEVQKQSGNSISNITNTTTTQIPEAARGPIIPSEKGYLIQEIGEDLYSVSDGSYNTMFMVTDEGVIAIDAPPTVGADYLKAITEITDKPITHVIYSHTHLDHIWATGIFPENATFIAQ